MYQPVTTPCIISAYQPNSDGYASVKITTAAGNVKSVKHHRLVYAKEHNMSLEEMKNWVVMHKCDTRRCINPEHLMLGTVAMNNQDKLNKGRNIGFPVGNTYQKQGAGNTRLTPLQVLAIRERKGEDQTALAREYGVTQAAISGILLRKTWKHI